MKVRRTPFALTLAAVSIGVLAACSDEADRAAEAPNTPPPVTAPAETTPPPAPVPDTSNVTPPPVEPSSPPPGSDPAVTTDPTTPVPGSAPSTTGGSTTGSTGG